MDFIYRVELLLEVKLIEAVVAFVTVTTAPVEVAVTFVTFALMAAAKAVASLVEFPDLETR